MPSVAAPAANSRTPSSTLGALWLVYGVLRLVVATLLILYSPTATVMFGALLARVPDPLAFMSLFHFLYAALIVLTVLAGIFALLAGLALLAAKSSARLLALVASFLSLPDLPCGTTLGIYTLIVFLR